MVDHRPVLFVIGILLSTLAATMVLPGLVDLADGHPDAGIFFASAAMTLFIGVALILTMRGGEMKLMVREAFLLTASSWLAVAVFGAVPLSFSAINIGYTDAFFEAMSGVTTTGSTILSGLDDAPRGVLLWRALLQWLGGIGIIVTAISLLPMLRVGGMQLFRMEQSDKSEKALPRAAQVAGGIGVIYLGLSIVCAMLYGLAGMSTFDAIAHTMTTVATGGYSTYDASLGHFGNAWIEVNAIIFMIAGGIPFMLYLRSVYGDWRALFTDTQVHWYLILLAGATGLMIAYLTITSSEAPLTALRMAAFNVVAIMTGTGYATEDFSAWGAFPIGLFFFLMFIGGCSGSTSCGMKVFRFQVLYAVASVQIRTLLQPHGVFVPYYNGRPIPSGVPIAVTSFFFLFVMTFAILALTLKATGLDFLSAMSAAATAICNVGPGLGDLVGPADNFASLSDTAKWLMATGMLLGRLELFTVLILLTPGFWRT